MREGSRIRIKICCIKSQDEARLAVSHGASALGFVSAMPSGPGVISEDEIAEIIPTVAEGIDTFLLTSQTSASAIISQQNRCGVNTIQLCDAIPPDQQQILREELPSVQLVQVIHVCGPAALNEALAASKWANALLLDSGNPNAAVKTLGGTGIRHDWSLSREIVSSVDIPVYLAGGINSTNVAEAIESVRPFGLDLCSSVRTNDQLDAAKLSDFFSAANTA